MAWCRPVLMALMALVGEHISINLLPGIGSGPGRAERQSVWFNLASTEGS